MAFDFPNTPAVGQVYAPAGGPSWQWDGTVWKSFQTNGEMALNRIAIPGPVASYTYNKPANLRYLEVEGCGGGGSGSAAIATPASTYSFGASGGGGAWGKKLFAAAALPASVTIVVGAGGASASGAGNAGGATTFGSLITLPGGIGGVQGSNTTTTGVIGPTTTTAAPTGVDFGSSGAMGGMTGALPSAWNHIGPGGSTPYGAGSPFILGSNGQVGGTGYGSGSSGCYNPPSSALKASVAAQPGIVILTEYLAVAPADVVQPARQVFKPTGTAGQIIPVPPTAKMAKVSGTIYMTGAGTPYLRFSIDGSTFIAGVSDYAVGGFNSYSGSTGAPVKQPFTTTNAYTLCPGTDSTVVPMMFDADIVVGKGANSQVFGCMSRGFGYNSAATTLLYEYYWAGYGSAGAFQTVSQMAAFLILPSANGFAAGTTIVVDWIY